MSDELLERLLNYDPLGNAEHITGKSYKEDKYTEAIGVLDHFRATKERRETLAMLDDTTISNTVENYTRIITEEGFEHVLTIPFADIDGTPESFQVWSHPDGMVLKFDTYRTKDINSASLYFNARLNDSSYLYTLRCGGGVSRFDNSVIVANFDAREALRFHIRKLRAAGTLVNPWIERPFLWFLHYMDTKVKDYDHAAITAERIAMLPEHVRKVIGA